MMINWCVPTSYPVLRSTALKNEAQLKLADVVFGRRPETRNGCAWVCAQELILLIRHG